MGTTPESILPLPALLRFLQPREFPFKLGICERFFGRQLAAAGTRWVRTAPGPLWKLDLTNATHRWIVFGSYEGPGFWRWFRRHGANATTIVDSGANIGQTVLYFCAGSPQAQVFAYEPGMVARTWLEDCVAANRFSQVVVSPCGLGEKEAQARLEPAGTQDRHGSWNRVGDTGEPIRLTTLDQEIDRLGLAHVDLWKLDMEGYELRALKGAARALEAGFVRRIWIEASGAEGRESLGYLRERGYVPRAVADSGELVQWTDGDRFENALCFSPREQIPT